MSLEILSDHSLRLLVDSQFDPLSDRGASAPDLKVLSPYRDTLPSHYYNIGMEEYLFDEKTFWPVAVVPLSI